MVTYNVDFGVGLCYVVSNLNHVIFNVGSLVKGHPTGWFKVGTFTSDPINSIGAYCVKS